MTASCRINARDRRLQLLGSILFIPDLDELLLASPRTLDRLDADSDISAFRFVTTTVTNSATPVSLLERIKANDEGAWVEFSGRYVRVLEKWCGAWNIQPFDAQDVIQETLLAVMNGIQNFDRRGTGSFRAWMKTIAWRSWRQTITKTERRKDLELLKSLETSTAHRDLEDQMDRLAVEELLQASMERARARVEEKTWQSFEFTALQLRPAVEVANALGMNVDAVYAARCRVQRCITEEFERLDQEC